MEEGRKADGLNRLTVGLKPRHYCTTEAGQMTDAGKRMLERYAKATPGPGVWQVTDLGWMRLPTGCGATKSTYMRPVTAS